VRASAHAERRGGESDNGNDSHVFEVLLLSSAGCRGFFYAVLIGQNNVNSSPTFRVIREYAALRLYLDGSSFGNEVEKLGDGGVGHADAAVTCGGAEVVLVICAVDVDVAGEGVLVLRIEPVKPEDAGLDEVAGIGGGADFAGEDAGLEDGAVGGAVADFFGDFETAGWGFEAAGFCAEAEGGGGDGEKAVGGGRVAEGEGLGGDGDVEGGHGGITNYEG
jgi:hypothetical protein